MRAKTPEPQRKIRFAIGSPLVTGALVAAIATSVYVAAPETGAPPALDAGPEPPAAAAALDPGALGVSQPKDAEAPVANPSSARVVQVRRGDTLIEVLIGAGVATAEAHGAAGALKAVFDPRALKPGQEITLIFGPASGDRMALVSATFASGADAQVDVRRGEDGRFTAAKRERTLAGEFVRVAGTVRASLFEAAAAAGVPVPVMVEAIRAFSYDVDFQRDVQPGDAFEVLFERFHDHEGRFAKDGPVLSAALGLSGKVKRIYRHRTPDGAVDYYDDEGHSVRKALLRTPIDGARLTSAFGNRKHPILGYSAMHRGVDFGAPEGTPVRAAGEGVVERVGWTGDYGHYVRIRHPGEHATAYAHLSRYAANLKVASRVRQGQVIGYVGSTGRSTGAHLHYEVLRRQRQINPMSVQLPAGRKLVGFELAEFRQAAAELDLKAGAQPAASRLAGAP
ncbi:MAG: peptidoglycan DD-metalloendopeptidase family protein [Pseudomonadota bacterium]